jgi:hypothetical protein
MPEVHVHVCLRPTGTVIGLKANLTNTGNVRLREVTWVPNWGSGSAVWSSNCTLDPTGATPATIASASEEVPVGQTLLCSGTFTFTQDVMELGAVKHFTATVGTKATDALVVIAAPTASATLVDVDVLIDPRLVVDVLETDCLIPYRAGKSHAHLSPCCQKPCAAAARDPCHSLWPCAADCCTWTCS